VERFGERGLRSLLELLAMPDRRRTLLVDRRSELRRLGVDPRLDVVQTLPQALLDHRDLALEPALGPLEVGLPCAEALLRALLARGGRRGQGVRELAPAAGGLAATLVRQPAFLDRVRGERVGM